MAFRNDAHLITFRVERGVKGKAVPVFMCLECRVSLVSRMGTVHLKTVKAVSRRAAEFAGKEKKMTKIKPCCLDLLCVPCASSESRLRRDERA